MGSTEARALGQILTVADLLLGATPAAAPLAALVPTLLPALLAAVPADSVVFGVAHDHPSTLFTEPAGLLTRTATAEFEQHAASDPLVVHTRSRLRSPVRRSDLQSGPRYRALGTYARVYRQLGADHQLALSFSTGPDRLACLVFNRSGTDFTDADVGLAAMLRPRLATVLTRSAPRPPAAGLTPREIQVLDLLSEGHDNQVIAHRLGVSPRTVEKHLEHAYTKLDLHGTGRVAVARRWLAL